MMIRDIILHDLDTRVDPPDHVLRLAQVENSLYLEVCKYDENYNTTLLQVVHRFRIDADMLNEILEVLEWDQTRGPGDVQTRQVIPPRGEATQGETRDEGQRQGPATHPERDSAASEGDSAAAESEEG